MYYDISTPTKSLDNNYWWIYASINYYSDPRPRTSLYLSFPRHVLLQFRSDIMLRQCLLTSQSFVQNTFQTVIALMIQMALVCPDNNSMTKLSNWLSNFYCFIPFLCRPHSQHFFQTVLVTWRAISRHCLLVSRLLASGIA